MFAITQTEYYLTLLKYIGLTTGTFVGAVAFFAIIYGIVVYSHYWR